MVILISYEYSLFPILLACFREYHLMVWLISRTNPGYCYSQCNREVEKWSSGPRLRRLVMPGEASRWFQGYRYYVAILCYIIDCFIGDT